jgi:hypothetical protein
LRTITRGARLAFGLAALAAGAAYADDPQAPRPDWELELGAGTTYHRWGWTGSLVIPVTLVLDADRYEIGVFRMATSQGFFDPTFRKRLRTADPYWGFSASRRWELRRARWRVFVGFGGSYKTEADMLSASKWNFAEQIGLRIRPSALTTVELALRHWSDAGLKLPNRGQDFITLTFAF